MEDAASTADDNPVAVVTGAAQGLGRAIAEVLLNAKYKVCITDVNETKGRETEQDLKTKFGSTNVMFGLCDVTERSQLERILEEVLKVFKRVDVLINNAGVLIEQDPLKTVMVNLMGPIYGCQVAMELMRKDKGGKGGAIVNTASIVGLIPMSTAPVYTASKHGVVGLTRSYGMPAVYEKTGVFFAALCPSFSDTELLHQLDCRVVGPIGELPELMEPSYVAQGVLKILKDRRNGSTLVVNKSKGHHYIDLGELENISFA